MNKDSNSRPQLGGKPPSLDAQHSTAQHPEGGKEADSFVCCLIQSWVWEEKETVLMCRARRISTRSF